ncbi:MAG: 2-phospho-L-lactate transferase [Betaproteobacteria bacterium]|nr:2-phospho-L-lactate transferase [Betaproteobacteria bacterium]
MGTVVALSGQVGGAKLAEGLYRLRGKSLAVICNTGDDYEHLGLALAPDLDTALYALAGIASPSAGWEPVNETQNLYRMVKTLGGPDRVPLGDQATAFALLRADGLRNDRRLTEISLDFCRQLGVEARIMPMSDDLVRTYVQLEDGSVTFQDYFAQMSCEPPVKGFQYAGAEDARIPDEVMDALHAEDLEAVVICPANPYHVIRPILAVNGMTEMLRKRGAPVIAVTPIIGGKALKGSAGKMMRELGHEVTARAVALEYLRLIDGFVIDSEDEADSDGILASGIEVMTANTIMRNADDRLRLARTVLDFAHAIRERKAAELDA